MAASAAAEAAASEGAQISEEEAAIYDRQIRLWGVEAQRRLRSSRILFCGFRGLNAEICKNLVLGGVSVTIQDAEAVLEEDLGANFFLKPDAVGSNVSAGCQRAQARRDL